MIGDAARRAIVDLIRDNTPRQVTVAQVVKVDTSKMTCEAVELESEQKLYGVRLAANNKGSKTVVIPKAGSVVLVGIIGNNRQSRYVAMVSEAESIMLMGDSNGGLCITPELKTQLDKLTARVDTIINAINAGVPATGAPDSGTALIASIKAVLSGMPPKESFKNIENTKVTH